MLSNWTGLKLHPDFAGDSDDEEEEAQNRREPVGGAQRCSIRKWKKGNYTLLHDADSNERASVDLFLHIFPNQKLGKPTQILLTRCNLRILFRVGHCSRRFCFVFDQRRR